MAPKSSKQKFLGVQDMEVGFFFWPFNPGLIESLADHADRYG
jgi:hypothetical protein